MEQLVPGDGDGGKGATPNPEISEKFVDRKFIQPYGGEHF